MIPSGSLVTASLAGRAGEVKGLLELAVAAVLLSPRSAPVAAIALIVLLVAMCPANVRAALAGLTMGAKSASPLRPRTAIQVAFLVAAATAI